MRKLIFAISLLIISGMAASAQSHGYVLIAPGGLSGSGYTNGVYHIGVGADAVFWRGLGFSPEVGYVTGTTSNFQDGFGLGSLNGTYHFARRNRLDPFVTGGYSIIFRSGHVNLANFGGGVNWWFLKRLGLKLEFRDHVDVQNGGNFHLWQGRFGLTFR